ncbi:MAG TPA: L-serine ammonia-lyase, iron-sulfur-dependent, subunit alpha [Bacteroidales bacterium]|nr:L-serine ammonia-lyase, iron-sulfur-dependent, subunit alpha [Bacteroidales bacterium]
MKIKNTALLEKLRSARLRDEKYFSELMPDKYIEVTDTDDFAQHESFIQKFYGNDKKACRYHYEGDIEDFIFIDYHVQKLRDQILRITKVLQGKDLFYRLFPNRNEGFILAAIYRDVMLSSRAHEFSPPEFEPVQKIFFDYEGKLKTHLESLYYSENNTIVIQCVNVAHKTMLGNLIETLDQHDTEVAMIEVWRSKYINPKVNSFYNITIHLNSAISNDEAESLHNDFFRYMQHYTEPMSIFDLVGPAMVGPSSSHTAGANRIGQIARNVMLALVNQGEEIQRVGVRLLGSFRDTGVGHKTPSALGGGLWGLATDDENMIAHGNPEFLKLQGIDLNGKKIQFTGFVKGSPADELKYIGEKNSNIAEILVETGNRTHLITGFSIGGGNVEVRYINGRLAKPINGKSDWYLTENGFTDIKPESGNYSVIRRIFSDTSINPGYIIPFNTFEELIDYSHQNHKSLADVAMMVETGLQNTTVDSIRKKMLEYWKVMKQSVEKGVNSNQLSMLKLSGDDAMKIRDYTQTRGIFDNIYGRAVAYATAVNELNAKSGLIVACPTAGSCGIVPGTMQAYSELSAKADSVIVDALIVSGLLGMLMFNDVSTAGADYGCQAEVGAAAAMAASALCYAEGGNSEQVINAFTLAIKNCLGLICDPIAGLVEVPCVKRNGIYSSVAISAALMALSGVKSFVSPDEVILTMREVGDRINSDYKETARGGLAKTRDGKHVERMFESEVKKFFD